MHREPEDDAQEPNEMAELLGMEGLPQSGDQFLVVADRDRARGISDYREQKFREATLAKSSRVSLEGLARRMIQAVREPQQQRQDIQMPELDGSARDQSPEEQRLDHGR